MRVWSRTGVASYILVAVLLGLMLFAAGCSSAQMQSQTAKDAAANAKLAAAGGASDASTMQGMASDASAQGCAACTTVKEPAPVTGDVQTVDGTQVLTVGIVDGYYTPNRFVAKSGSPIRVVFKVEGKPAKACVSKPTFKSLNKTTVVTQGEQGIDLGTLSPGVYGFSCGMGANKGTVTVE